jgi:D-alanyl-lipoteichoic acid acyltransferase DltB (MBOAT superfamily)
MLAWLALTSLYFYGYWNPAYLFLLLGSILVNFAISQFIAAGRPEGVRSRWLTVGIIVNLAALGYYKYLFPILNFFESHGLGHHGYQSVLLPLGISFFTFTQIAYLIDLRQDIAIKQPIVPYAVFVTFYPHLIAGPIIHPRELMPQLAPGRIHGLNRDDLALGLTWFVLGLSKKVLIADRIAPLADVLYAHPHNAGFATAWLGSLCYTMQLYFDFSGYSDMAIGLARMFSLEFPLNFNSPFKAQNIIDFWQQFHMTLSRYLNEYLYTPIARWINGRRLEQGKKVSKKAQGTVEGFAQMVAFPTISTMFLAGIWHGAGLQYLIFGLLHGVYLTVNHAWRFLTPRGSRFHGVVPRPLLVLLTFLCVHVALVFFRAASTRDALYLVGTIFGFHGRGPAFMAFPFLGEIPKFSSFEVREGTTIAILVFCFAIVWGMPNTQEILGQYGTNDARLRSLFPTIRWRPTAVWSIGVASLFCAAILFLDASTRFLYFQF